MFDKPSFASRMLRKRESMADKLFRYRGVLLVASIPAALVVLVLIFMPRASSPGSNAAAEPGNHTYAVVFDAGSTGSRVHIFKFVQSDTGLDLLNDTFEQLKPGLGDAGWAANPAKAAASLTPLLEKAIQSVPVEDQATTPIELRATAGLRLLPGTQAQDILDAVALLLKSSPFRLVAGGVTILDGVDEGAYSWMTLNYLLGLIGHPHTDLVGVIDLGGGSVQQAFAVSDATAASAPEGYLKKMSGGGQKYNVYVFSYLGYGLMQGRGAVLSRPDGTQCVHKGSQGTYISPYGGKEYSMEATKEGSDFSTCAAAVEGALKVGAPCGSAATECSFNGAWGGAADHSTRRFFIMSYFFDRAMESGIITDKSAISQETTPGAFSAAAKAACKASLDQVPTVFTAVSDSSAQYMCLDLSFQYSLLTRGMKLSDSAPVTVAKKVKYNGEEFEAAWPLGAAINTLSS